MYFSEVRSSQILSKQQPEYFQFVSKYYVVAEFWRERFTQKSSVAEST